MAVFSLAVDPNNVRASDDDFESYLFYICNNNPPQELFQTCIDAFPGGGAGGPSAISSSNNLGVFGAQGRIATTAAIWQTKGVEERLEVLKTKEEQQKGGGASSDATLGQWSFFASARYADIERDAAELEAGYNSDLNGLTLGTDLRLTDKAVIGIALGYTDVEVDYDENAGRLDLESLDITLYGNYTPLANAYVDVYVGYADLDYDSERNVSFGLISGVAKGDPDGDQLLAGFAAGYDWNVNALTVGPTITLDYVKTKIDNYQETGNTGLELSYEDQTIYSLTTSVGVHASYAKAISWGVLIPQARFRYVHEHKDDSRSIDSTLNFSPTDAFTNNTEDTDRDYVIAGIGVSTVMRNGFQAFVDYEKLTSHDFLDTWTISAGFRKEF